MSNKTVFSEMNGSIACNVPTALRSGGERETNVSDSTKLPKREQYFKLNINPPFCKTDVI